MFLRCFRAHDFRGGKKMTAAPDCYPVVSNPSVDVLECHGFEEGNE